MAPIGLNFLKHLGHGHNLTVKFVKMKSETQHREIQIFYFNNTNSTTSLLLNFNSIKIFKHHTHYHHYHTYHYHTHTHYIHYYYHTHAHKEVFIEIGPLTCIPLGVNSSTTLIATELRNVLFKRPWPLDGPNRFKFSQTLRSRSQSDRKSWE